MADPVYVGTDCINHCSSCLLWQEPYPLHKCCSLVRSNSSMEYSSQTGCTALWLSQFSAGQLVAPSQRVKRHKTSKQIPRRHHSPLLLWLPTRSQVLVVEKRSQDGRGERAWGRDGRVRKYSVLRKEPNKYWWQDLAGGVCEPDHSRVQSWVLIPLKVFYLQESGLKMSRFFSIWKLCLRMARVENIFPQ